jgi:cyclic beta-1,2-glucan synthetase
MPVPSSLDVAPEIVRAFFAHHQGMSLVAMANILLDDVFVERFHADPRVKATELLLQERVPREAILAEARPAEGAACGTVDRHHSVEALRSPHTKSPHSHFLSNGRYTVALTHAGGGSSTWQGLAITRRREDRTSDSGGQFIYLRDPWSGEVWSPSYQPICREPDRYEAVFELEKATYRRRDGDFETQLQVVVSPEDDVEVRRLSITNRGDRPREIEVTSYAEIVLARPEDDLAHPAFAKLFIETAYDAQSAGLLFSRRPRSAEEPHPWAFHVLAIDGRLGGAIEWETDRARFLGRGRTLTDPAALDGRALSGTTGAVLDPVASVRERVGLAPGGFVRVTFATGVAQDRASALALVRKYRDASSAARAFSMASTHVHITLQHLGLTDDHAMLFDRLASRVFGSDTSSTNPDDIARNIGGQANLWRFGISGDLPIVLLHVATPTPLRSSASYCTHRSIGASRIFAPTWSSSTITLGIISTKCRTSCPACCASRDGAARSRSPAESSCCAPTECRTLIGTCCPLSRASSSAVILATWRPSSIAKRRGCRPPRLFRHPRYCDPRDQRRAQCHCRRG